MCLTLDTVCPSCGKVADQTYQICPYQGPAAGHKVYQQTQTVQFPMIYWQSCSTPRCELNWNLHWSLASRHQRALAEGTGYSPLRTYKPLAFDDEGDEACELALDPPEVGLLRGPPADFLSAKARVFVRNMVLKGATSQDIADALERKGATAEKYSAAYISKYTHAYIRPNLQLFVEKASVPAPSTAPEKVGDGLEREFMSELCDEEESCFFLESMVRVPGAPAPRWLSAEEVRLLLSMRRQGKSKKAMVTALDKSRVMLIKYINTYVVPYENTVPSDSEDTALPDPGPVTKRKRTEEPQSERQRSSKRLRRNNGASSEK